MKVEISRIKVGERMRSDFGAMDELQESMKKHGCISPITINNKFELLAGYRRLQAAINLGWEEIECNVITTRTPLERFEIEIDENILRKNFNSEEMQKILERGRELRARGCKKLYYRIRSFFRLVTSFFYRKSTP